MNILPQPKTKFGQMLRSLLETAVMAAFIIIFIAQSFVVEGISMLPNLRPGERLLVEKVSYRFRPPARGDIVVLKYPPYPSRTPLIKRVIGLPGDEIEVKLGQLYINGEPLEESYLSQPTYGRFGPVQVPENTVFVMGDNRNNSEDSRDPRVGFVPFKLIIGRAVWRYWPLHRMSLVRAPSILRALD